MGFYCIALSESEFSYLSVCLLRCTRENEHPRKRAPVQTTPAYSDTEAKFSSQTQPRKCAPTANLDTQLTAFCTRSTFCTRWSKPVDEFWLQIWLILRFCTLPDQNLPRHKTSVFRDVLQNENCNFRKGPGTRCEKNGACSRISTRKFVWTAFFANKFFVSRSDFREVNPVVQLVQNGGSVGSFRSTGFASIFFYHRDLDFGDVELINVWTLVSGMQDGFLNLVQQ